MSKTIKLDVTPDMTNDQIRQVARTNPNNGAYATAICRKCGSFWCHPDGDWRTAVIQDGCKNCATFPVVKD